MNSARADDPFLILGVTQNDDEATVRARYLELVKQFSPDCEPERFLEIRNAYEATRDPLTVAQRLLHPPGDEVAKWSSVIEAQEKNPPRLSPSFLLSLGNRSAADSSAPSA